MSIYRRIGFQPVRGALTDRLEAYPTGTAARLIPFLLATWQPPTTAKTIAFPAVCDDV